MRQKGDAMKWNLSLRLEPGEEVIEGPGEFSNFSLATMSTPILTNRRAAFKFNALSTGLIQSFPYEHITDAQAVTRLLIKYLKLTARGREYFLNVTEPEIWAEKIHINKERFQDDAPPAAPTRQKPSISELLGMLDSLKEYGVLTDEECAEKRKKILG